MNDAVAKFRDAIRAAGMEPPATIKAGIFHRFPGIGKHNGNIAGWCKFDESGHGGYFGDWASGLSENWYAPSFKQLNEDEKAEYKHNREKAKERAEKDKKRQQANTARNATDIWNKASPADMNHPYLVSKEIQPFAARQSKDILIIPILFKDKLISLQFIYPNGSKKFLKGGLVTGGHCAVADTQVTKTICIAEGFATASTVHEATGLFTIIAFSARSLETVAKYVRQTIPKSSIVICADDDVEIKGNPGITEANKAARAVGAKVAIPEFGDKRPDGVSDFNDMAAHSGIEAVKQAINSASKPADSDDSEEIDWPKLVPLDFPNLPSLERDCLPTWAGDYAHALAANSETPLELAVGMVLATCSTACARRMKVLVRPGYCEPCNLWILVALPPGNRKSSVQSAATEPLIKWESAQAANMQDDILRATSERKTMEAHIKDKRNKSARKKGSELKAFMKEIADLELELPEIPSVPRLWTSDSTPERLGTLLEENQECLGWMSSEGGIFELLEGRYSKGIPNLDLVLKAHSGDSECVDRGSRPPLELEYPRLSVGLSPQPDVLKGLASKPGFRGRGLLARFIYFLPPSPLGFRTLDGPAVPDDTKQAYMQGIHAMLNWKADTDKNKKVHPHEVRISNDALSVHHEFALAIEKEFRPEGRLEHFKDWGGKISGAAIRMAGVLHGIKHAHERPWEFEISKETMEAALNIIAVSIDHSLAALDMMGADQTVAGARRVWGWIKRHKRPSFTVREAFSDHRSIFIRVKYMNEALEVLEERGYVQIITPKTKGPGRPSKAVIVRPELVESWK
ncbi:MAG: DUF3987 domain-containing protein [Gammaproteobacteria bacterium]|nr:DUF3987 domain-containing protein [Gammaproteobacteria bacterium]